MFGLTDKVLWSATGIFVALLLLTLSVKYWQVNSLRADLAECNQKVILLSSAIEKQNKAIDDMAKDSAKRIATAKERYNAQRIISEARLDKIEALQRELGKEKLTCEQAVEIAKGKL